MTSMLVHYHCAISVIDCSKMSGFYPIELQHYQNWAAHDWAPFLFTDESSYEFNPVCHQWCGDDLEM